MFEDTKYRNILDILGVVIIVLLAVQLIGQDRKTTALQNADVPAISSSVDITEQSTKTDKQNYVANENLKFKKVKASNEQIKRQKEINAFRKSQGLPEFPIKDYAYVSNDNKPAREIKTPQAKTELKQVALKSSDTKQPQTTTGTSRILTGDELKISNIRTQYSNYMEYCVRSNWVNPTKNNSYSAAFTFNMDKDGRITAYDILRSSDSTVYDKAAIQCLLDTAPFKPIPKELQMDGLNAQVYFNGVEVQINGFSKIKPTYLLTYDVDQTNKVCRTIEINQAKDLRTQSSFPASAPRDLHWEMGKQVQSNWNPPLKENSSVCLTFRVFRTGAIKNIKFVTKAFDDNANIAAYNAINNLKLKPFPLSDKRLYIDVRYWFYIVDNKR